jgi:hypothetical protein
MWNVCLWGYLIPQLWNASEQLFGRAISLWLWTLPASEAADARQALYRLHDELTEVNPSAAGSLMEGMEETLTVAELRITPRLRQTLSSTNAIESSFPVAEKICNR